MREVDFLLRGLLLTHDNYRSLNLSTVFNARCISRRMENINPLRELQRSRGMIFFPSEKQKSCLILSEHSCFPVFFCRIPQNSFSIETKRASYFYLLINYLSKTNLFLWIKNYRKKNSLKLTAKIIS